MTGTVLPATVAPTTSPTALAASSVVLSRMSFLLLAAAALTLKCLAPGEVSGWEMAAPALVVVGGLDGNLEIGFVPGSLLR